MNDPFPIQDFDDWAESYDESVSVDVFPFDGYRKVLDTVVELAEPRPGMTVLDLGTGTGNLAALFARRGCELWCTDFAPAMLARAKRKLPQARLLRHDLRTAWPPELDRRFDRIVSAYVFHHFRLKEKVHILEECRARLAPDGTIVLADIAFPDAAAQERARIAAGADWEQEFYWLCDEAVPALERDGWAVTQRQVSSCAGVFTIAPQT
jgi:putative AdoMet-dependent methyltransferase